MKKYDYTLTKKLAWWALVAFVALTFGWTYPMTIWQAATVGGGGNIMAAGLMTFLWGIMALVYLRARKERKARKNG